jgi:hypothetical protein
MKLLERLGARATEPTAPPLVVVTGSASWRHRVQVKICGDLGGAAALAAALPSGWTLDGPDPVPVSGADLIVVVAGLQTRADAAMVASVHALHPRDPLLAIVPALADVSVVVAALDAGADACVRTASAAVVASHLLSMQRRRELERMDRFAGTA